MFPRNKIKLGGFIGDIANSIGIAPALGFFLGGPIGAGIGLAVNEVEGQRQQRRLAGQRANETRWEVDQATRRRKEAEDLAERRAYAKIYRQRQRALAAASAAPSGFMPGPTIGGTIVGTGTVTFGPNQRLGVANSNSKISLGS